jgi:hypothetical protein
MHLLRTLASQGEERHAAFERRHPLATVVSVVDAFPPGLVEGAIKRYQDVIRGNSWYFPTLCDVDVVSFLVRWGEVHAMYFATAEDIFELVAKGESSSVLASSALLTRVIQSETMRGWVGKRSPSGLDALLDTRVRQLEDMLAPLGDDAVDDVLSVGGIYVGDSLRVTAEHEVVRLFATYHREVGQELDAAMLDGQPIDSVVQLLRGFCRYSLAEFNRKYQLLHGVSSKRPQSASSAAEAHELVSRRLAGLPTSLRDEVNALLEELRILNYLNLNLEVKYSFKGWAGLMHVLVVAACSDATNISTDVYAMLNALKEAGK